ncbi:Uncharacterized protein dnl_48220 [Desulfonema limicola]|uniref:Transposase n=1 Tax=Desulfonema limicola TaxID=45656 RepID=A0A975BBN5_9BACT|nr:hypothetical protein [Desulfonema limicola]QTA82447.1 Uncharacterized protein dnl_48220 [Desulfonema limicola]
MEYDNPWKEALEVYFEAFMQFFFSRIHLEIDWSRGYEFLDKELEKTLRDAELGTRYADKLVKVFLLNGIETWLLIHIEIQNWKDKVFEKRMFVYNYRIFDRYEVEVVSLAVLTDDNKKWCPREYHTERWGCEHIFRFPVIKLLDYKKDWEKLEQDQNPFALVVMAHLKSQEVKDGQERKRWKLRLMRLLFERGYSRQDILELFRFIDWLLELPENIEKQFQDELAEIKEEKKMAYVTSIERLAKKEGIKEMILEYISTRFKSVPEDISSLINSIKTADKLKALFRQAITCESLDDFREVLKTAD